MNEMLRWGILSSYILYQAIIIYKSYIHIYLFDKGFFSSIFERPRIYYYKIANHVLNFYSYFEYWLLYPSR
jgi:hypothetical protein